MDRAGGRWSEDGTTDRNSALEGGEKGCADPHHYYCPVYVGGLCSCPVEQEPTNNNDYTKLKKVPHSKKAHHSKRSEYSGEAYYGDDEEQLSYDHYYGASYPDTEQAYLEEENYCSTNDYSTSATTSSYPNSHHTRTSYCHYNSKSSSIDNNSHRNSSIDNIRGKKTAAGCGCHHSSSHHNSSYCDYFDTLKTYGSSCNHSNETSKAYYGSSSCNYSNEGSFNPPKIQVTAKILFGTVNAITDLKQKKAAKKN